MLTRLRFTCILPALTLLACAAQTPTQQANIGGHTVPSRQLTAEEVRASTTAVRRGDLLIYRAPVLSLTQTVDMRTGGLTTSGGMGIVELARSGYLFAEKDPASGSVRNFAVFQWDLVEGANRYHSVALSDGRSLPFRTATATPDPCVPNCFPVIQTVIVEVPVDALQAAATQSGLSLIVTLDNGHSFPVAAPPAYVRGYLDAVYAAGG